jgi:hypothetical protein
MVFMLKAESVLAGDWPYLRAKIELTPRLEFSLDLVFGGVVTIRGRSPNERENFLSGCASMRFATVVR